MNNGFKFIKNNYLDDRLSKISILLNNIGFTDVETAYVKYYDSYFVNVYATYDNKHQAILTTTIKNFESHSSGWSNEIGDYNKIIKDLSDELRNKEKGYQLKYQQIQILNDKFFELINRSNYNEIKQHDEEIKKYYVALTNNNQVIPESTSDNYEKTNQLGFNFTGNKDSYIVNEITEEKFNKLK